MLFSETAVRNICCKGLKLIINLQTFQMHRARGVKYLPNVLVIVLQVVTIQTRYVVEYVVQDATAQHPSTFGIRDDVFHPSFALPRKVSCFCCVSLFE